MAKNNEDYLSIRITSQKTYIGSYRFNQKSGVFDIDYFFSIPFNFNYQGLNLKEYTTTISLELAKRDIKTKKVIFNIFSHDIIISTTTTIKQPKYLENVKVIESVVKTENSLIEKSKISLAYKPVSEFSETPINLEKDDSVNQKKKKKNDKKPKEIQKMNAISYSVPIEVLDTIQEIAELLKKEILYIDFAPNGVYNYYNRYIAKPNDNILLVHVSTDCTVITSVNNGIMIDQVVDNFSYSGMQSALSMYKTSLRSNLTDVDETIDAINNTFLYTITKEDLDRIPQLNEIEKSQIIEAKSALIDYTMDFLDRLGIIVGRESKSGNQLFGVYIYHDKANFPDLSSTISDSIELPVQNLMLSTNVLRGADRLQSIDYILTTFCCIVDPLQLDIRLLQRKKGHQIQRKALYGIVLSTFFISIGIIVYFLASYIIASNKNTELNQKLLEAQEAEDVYNRYMSVSNAYNSVNSFKESNKSDLSDLDEQMRKIASVMPKDGCTVSSMTASSGTNGSAGSITMSVETKDKDTMAKFITGLESIEVFEKVEQSGVSDSMGDSDRKVSGTILCTYAVEEQPTPEQSEETSAEDTTDDTTDEDMPLPEG